MKRHKPLDPQRFQRAVKIVAFLKAKDAVKAEIRGRGEKIAHYSCRDITSLAEAYFTAHCEELITKAIADCWRFPEFARYRQSA